MQQRAVAVLDWLLEENGERGTGRTLAIAVALVRKALRNPSVWVAYFDHFPQALRGQRGIVARAVHHLVRSDQRLAIAWFEFRDDSFRVRGPATLPDWETWLPAESVLEATLPNLRSSHQTMRDLAFGRELDDLFSVATGDRPFVQTAAGTGELAPPPKQPRSRYERMLEDD